jgi:PAS domain S-box-containing protein
MGEKIKFLIVEDNDNDVILLLHALRMGGIDPFHKTVTTASEMDEALQNEPWDIIICDCLLPKFSGFEALKLYKSKNIDIPFIILSGAIGEETAVEFMRSGAHDYLMKNNISRLIPTINRELTEANVRRDRKIAEKNLRESERRFRQLVERASDSLFLHDFSGNFIDVNLEACQSLGYSRQELLKMNVSDIEVDYDASMLKDIWETVNNPQTPITIYGTHRRKDGTAFPVELRIGAFEFDGKLLILALARNITERKKVEQNLRQALHEKEILLREIHHRVKNNLQIIYSLLNLQSECLYDPSVLEVFRECQNRLKAMAILHEVVYRADDLGLIDFKEYITTLSSHIVRSYGYSFGQDIISIQSEDVRFGYDLVIPCGLIVCELVSNSLKYAFPEKRSGSISIELLSQDETYYMTVSDNGVGFPADIDFENTSTLGLKLVNTLVKQVDGCIELKRGKGTKFIISFPRIKGKGDQQ